MDVAALVLSIVALLFTGYTFWWQHWRPARLVVSSPRVYAGFGTSDKLLLEFPFVFYNDGARAIVVDDLRLRLPNDGGSPLGFNATVAAIGTDQGRTFATPFFVGAQQAEVRICEFQRRPGDLVFERRDYKVIVEARLGGLERWSHLNTFTLRVTDQALKTLGSRFLVHPNSV